MRISTDSLAPVPARPRQDPVEAIGRAPWKHDFFHALRWIDASHPDKPLLGTARRPLDEPVRLGQVADLSFAPSALHRVAPATAYSKARIEVRFFGFFGPNGPLPFHLTEYARERALHHGDSSFVRFADMFHHRLLLMFYRAWAQAQPLVALDRPGDDRFSAYVGSLIGEAGRSGSAHTGAAAAPAKRAALSAHATLHFAGLLSRQVRNADGLATILSIYLGRTVRVEQFVGRWLELAPAERSRLGGVSLRRRDPSMQLGSGLALGKTVWDRQHNFRIHVDSLDAATFDSLLPGGKELPAVEALVAQYVGIEFAWDLQLQLPAEQVKPCLLGRAVQLGWTACIGSRPRSNPMTLHLSPRIAR